MLIEHKCYSCFACVNACPRNCISMVKNDCGELRPQINIVSCIQCNQCQQVCPALHHVSRNIPHNILAVTRKVPRDERFASAGVAYAIAEKVIETGGVVYATIMQKDTAYMDRITDMDGLKRTCGSKYVLSNIGGMLQSIKRDLQSDRLVAIFALPCQLAGVLRYLKKDYAKLLLVDLFCHGTTSHDCFKNGLQLDVRRSAEQITFRDGKQYVMKILDEHGETTRVHYRVSYWFQGFLEGYLLRECCFECSFSNLERVGDISLGDFWGLGEDIPTSLDASEGANAVLLNSEKGIKAWSLVMDQFHIEEHNAESVKRHNSAVNGGVVRPRQYDRFLAIYRRQGGKSAILHAYPKKTWSIRIRKAIRFNKLLYKLLTKIPMLKSKL